MIIDCHGHYTTTPKELGDYRDQQKADLKKNPQHQAQKGTLKISDDQLRESVEGAQLKLQRERGTDVTIFSPRASWMGHHLGNASTSKAWTEHCNDLIYRLTKLYPKNFVGVAQLPQSPGAPIDSSVRELVRCVEELGFVGCNLNPDTSGGFFNGPEPRRSLLVSALREDVRARRAGDDPRQRGVQHAVFPDDGLVLPRGRHRGVHADDDVGSVQGFPGAEADHSARRRRRAVSLGPLPRARRHAEAAAARRSRC